MNNGVNEIILRSKADREPMDFDRLKFICYFVASMVAEVLGFALAFVFILGMFGVFK